MIKPAFRMSRSVKVGRPFFPPAHSYAPLDACFLSPSLLVLHWVPLFRQVLHRPGKRWRTLTTGKSRIVDWSNEGPIPMQVARCVLDIIEICCHRRSGSARSNIDI